MARLACRAGVIVSVLAAATAQAGPEQVQPQGPGILVPAGSFESAGLAVFVRAHEARRGAGASGLPSSGQLAYSPVVAGVLVEALYTPVPLAVEMPTASVTSLSNRVSPVDQPNHPGSIYPREP